MKFKVSIFLAAIFFGIMPSCKDEGFFSEQAPENTLAKFQDRGKEPAFSLDWINKRQITPGENEVSEDFVEIVGWAIDPDAGKPGAKVFLTINGTLFTTEYGVVREDVATHFNDPSYKNSGFIAKFSRSTFVPGTYNIGVIVISADNSAFFQNTPERAVSLKI